MSGTTDSQVQEPIVKGRIKVVDRARVGHDAHYREFVQLERRKKNGQFGANRTVVSMMPNGVVAAAMPCEAMSLSMVIRLG